MCSALGSVCSYLMQTELSLMNKLLNEVSDEEHPADHQDEREGKRHAVEVSERPREKVE